jgi:predicted nucleic acid-binding protein
MAIGRSLADKSAFEQQRHSGAADGVLRALAADGALCMSEIAAPDLLVAATALEHDATVLHYDRDFDLIAEVTDLSARWIIPPGTGHGASI